MSSQRLAKIAAAMLRLVGGSLADPAEPEGSSCVCDACEDAWRRNRKPKEASRGPLATRRRMNVE